MDIVFFLFACSLILGIIFLISFIFSINKGQFDDLDSPAHRILCNDKDKGNL